MAPAINFISGGGSFPINNLAGSGLGFYGTAAFGTSVAVGSWQNRTFITDSNGVIQGPEVNNVTWLNSASGVLGSAGSGIALTAMPNWQATLNIRFTNDTAVKTQNAYVMIYDRVNVNNAASGVTTKAAELIHPYPTQGPGGSGDTSWWTFNTAATGQQMDLVASPGMSGLRPSGINTTDIQHDWYIALSASPDSIGSKNAYALYASLEYL